MSQSTYRFYITVEQGDLVTHQLKSDLSRLLADADIASDELVSKWPAQIPTYDLIKWMEISAATVASKHYPPESISRGTEVVFKPFAEAFLGEYLTIVVDIVKKNRKFIYFDIRVLKKQDVLVAQMTHKRFIQRKIESRDELLV